MTDPSRSVMDAAQRGDWRCKGLGLQVTFNAACTASSSFLKPNETSTVLPFRKNAGVVRKLLCSRRRTPEPWRVDIRAWRPGSNGCWRSFRSWRSLSGHGARQKVDAFGTRCHRSGVGVARRDVLRSSWPPHGDGLSLLGLTVGVWRRRVCGSSNRPGMAIRAPSRTRLHHVASGHCGSQHGRMWQGIAVLFHH
jgi:hypothetical protein